MNSPARASRAEPTNSSAEEMLSQHPFTRGMDPAQIDRLGGCGEPRTIPAGEYLWRQGNLADTLFIVQSGVVTLEIWIPNQGPLAVETVSGQEVVGWSWFGPPHLWHFDARAVTNVTGLALNGVCVESACELDARLGYELLKRLNVIVATRLQKSRLRLLDLYKNSAGSSRAAGY